KKRFSRMLRIGIINMNNNSIQIVLSNTAPNKTGFQPYSKSGNKSDNFLSGKFIKVIECPVNMTIKKRMLAVNAIPFTSFNAPLIDSNKKLTTNIHTGVCGKNTALTISTKEPNDNEARNIKEMMRMMTVILLRKIPTISFKDSKLSSLV